jgi:hypothetical protein
LQEVQPSGRHGDGVRAPVQHSHHCLDEHAARAYAGSSRKLVPEGKTILIADGQIATRDTVPFGAASIPVIDPWML